MVLNGEAANLQLTYTGSLTSRIWCGRSFSGRDLKRAVAKSFHSKSVFKWLWGFPPSHTLSKKLRISESQSAGGFQEETVRHLESCCLAVLPPTSSTYIQYFLNTDKAESFQSFHLRILLSDQLNPRVTPGNPGEQGRNADTLNHSDRCGSVLFIRHQFYEHSVSFDPFF